jgi:hypothetical protein
MSGWTDTAPVPKTEIVLWFSVPLLQLDTNTTINTKAYAKKHLVFTELSPFSQKSYK